MRCKVPTKGGGEHLHAHDKASHKGEACFFEQGPCSAHMVLINSSRPAFCKFPEVPVLKKKRFYLGFTLLMTNLALLPTVLGC